MKKIFFFILLSLSMNAFSKCKEPHFSIYPYSDNLPQNSLILIQGNTNTQKEIISLLNKDFPIYLKSNNEIVNLNVKEIFSGQSLTKQAILIPERKLIIGEEYELIIENINSNEKELLSKYNHDTKKFESIKWIITNSNHSITRIKEKPEFLSFNSQSYGCGPSQNVNFKFPDSESESIILKSELIDLKTNIKTTYCIIKNKGENLSIGRSMCGGEFYFNLNSFYKIRFNIIDDEGNESKNWSEWIEFETIKKR
ncbi:hypothetical protein [Wenyingzhuangia aestuarii]|uniref:hypothetical protein n=1 Tax=Wenyingzhuangia aestuarii TaxID=1647582 RepID=UPI00143A8E89|nr:hypothetical protein [Wenyingzhuangia aestuarii]NJB84213.1 hypothetical protein [Wenyingzhuangia aestuarii]